MRTSFATQFFLFLRTSRTSPTLWALQKWPTSSDFMDSALLIVSGTSKLVVQPLATDFTRAWIGYLLPSLRESRPTAMCADGGMFHRWTFYVSAAYIADPPAAFFFLWLTIHVKIEVGKVPCIFIFKPDQFGHTFPCPLTFLFIYR